MTANAQCDTEAVTALYNKFLTDHKGTPEQRKAASETAKEYLSKFGECPTDAEKKIAAFVKGWQSRFEAELIESSCTNAVDKTPAQAFQLCQPYLAKDRENLRAYLLLSHAGFKSARGADQSAKAETVKAARKALELIKSGKSVDRWILADNKDETAGTLEFYSASLTADTTPVETAASMRNLARSSTSYSKDPTTYLYLGGSLYASEAKKLIEDYKQTCIGKDGTPECNAASAKIDAAIDRVIDAYARAVALSAGKPEFARVAAAAKPALTDLYRERHENSETGLDKFIAEVLSKPIP
ncbi:MAG: hypothetical protein H0U23_16355 [Blastocatellia bacterium]|nr:hypothetical protein [Blastocatellia bacterium]